jgi:signal peptidase I
MYSPVVIYQMNEPIAKLWALSPTHSKGELFPNLLLQNPQMTYSNLWGIENFAKARLLTKEQVIQITDNDPNTLEEGLLYLELIHSPSITHTRIGRDDRNRLRPLAGTYKSIIPLQESHLKAIFDNLYTSRFVVEKGFAHRYGLSSQYLVNNQFFPYLPDVPNGTYEFYYGKGYGVKWQGITSELPSSSPLYRFDPARVQMLFNLGIEFDIRYGPQSQIQYLTPSRYAYFRNGDLYLMGAPILKKDDPILISFVEREKNKQLASRDQKPYPAFIDKGPPFYPMEK